MLEDLRDAYPGGLEETILTELIANSLDAGANTLRLWADPAAATFRLVDDGRGMQWKELRQFHNLAASTKVRGAGIGFAGVGIKLALLASREVVTESCRGRSRAASRWHLASREFAPYEPIESPGFVGQHGTAVVLHLHHGLSPLVDAGYLEHVLRLHFQPLLDSAFNPVLVPLYPNGVRFEVNGRTLEPVTATAPEQALLEVRIERQRKPSGLGYIERHAQPLPEHLRGIAVSTYGKVIRRGWDWLGILPASPERVTGILEVPALSQALTLNKGDFVRTGSRGALYLSYRRAIQEAVQSQLTRWGDARDVTQETRRRAARPLERDLERVLEHLSDEFPLLAALVEKQRGGQRRIALAGNGRGSGMGHGGEAPGRAGERPGDEGAGFEIGAEVRGVEGRAGEATSLGTDSFKSVAAQSTQIPTSESRDHGPTALGIAPPPPFEDPARKHDAARIAEPADAGGAGQIARLGRVTVPRRGLELQFEERPGDPELARLIEATVWINTAHPAYRRAESTRSTGYHIAVSAALALAPLATGGAGVQQFITAFLAQWGGAVRKTATATGTARRRN